MEAARLTAIIEAKDQGVAEKLRATDDALAGLGRTAQDTAAKAVRLTEAVALQSRQLDAARGELAQIVARYGEASAAAEKKRITIDRLEASMAQNQRRLQQTREDLGNLGKGFGDFSEIATGALRRVGEIGVDALGRAAQALGDLGKEAAQQYIVYENLQGSTTALVAAELTSADASLSMADAMKQAAPAAEALLGWQQQLALNSPFSEDGIARVFQQAQAYGFLSETISKTDVDAKRLTAAVLDYAAATRRGEEGANGVALALGQIQAKGKLSAEELNQLSERGINARQILADAFGVTTQELVQMQEKGLIPADKAVQAIVSRLEKDFSGAAANASQTFGGTLDRIQELKDVGLREFFAGTAEAVQPALSHMADALSDPAIREGIKQNGDAFGRWVQDVVEGAAVAGGALDRVKQMVAEQGSRAAGVPGGLGFLQGMQQGFAGLNPLAPLMGSMDSLAGGIADFSGVQQQADAQRGAADAAREQAAAVTDAQAAMRGYLGATTMLTSAQRDLATETGRASPGKAGGQRGGMGGALFGADPKVEQEAQAHAERLADIATKGREKIADATKAHGEKMSDLERDAGRGAEDRAKEHADKLISLAQDRAQKESDLRTDLARGAEDLERDHQARLADLTQTAGGKRADLARDLGRREEDAARQSAEKRADIAQDLQRKLEDLDRSAEDRRATAQFRLSEQLIAIDERAAERRRSLQEQLGTASTTAEQSKIQGQITALDRQTAEERASAEAKAGRESAFQADQDQRDREAAQLAAERKRADQEAADQEAEAQRARDAERRRADLEADIATQVEAERQAYAAREAERQTEAERKLSDIQAEAQRALEAEQTANAQREDEARASMARRLADEQASYAERMAALRAAVAAERAVEAERYTPQQAGSLGGGPAIGQLVVQGMDVDSIVRKVRDELIRVNRATGGGALS